MIKIGCHLSIAKGYENVAKQALAIGATTMQFFSRNPRGGKARDMDANDVEKFLKILSENHFGKLVVHAPYTLNPCSKDKKVRNFAFMAMEEDLKRMECIPGNYYNFHPGSHVGQGTTEGILLIAALLNEILTPSQSTVVLLETMSGKGSEIGSRFEELAEIIDRVEQKEKIGVCMDTCHVNDAGYDIVHDLDGVLKEFDRVVGLDKLHAVHVNDSQNPLGAHKDRHAKIGEGHLGVKTVATLINHPDLRQLPFILETPNDLDGYAREIALIKKLYREESV